MYHPAGGVYIACDYTDSHRVGCRNGCAHNIVDADPDPDATTHAHPHFASAAGGLASPGRRR